jgi:hypothetical protein
MNRQNQSPSAASRSCAARAAGACSQAASGRVSEAPSAVVAVHAPLLSRERPEGRS